MRCRGYWVKRKVAAVGFFALCTLLGVIMYQTEINKAWPGNVATGIRTRNQGHTLGEAVIFEKQLKKDKAIQEPEKRIKKTASNEMMPRSPNLSSKDRLRTIRKSCAADKRRSLAQLSLSEKQILFKHIIVNDEHRFMFCYVPKVACSNWKRVLMVLDRKASDVNTIQKMNHKSFTFLSDLPPLAIERKIKSYFKFMFVRDPLERLVSAYNNKFVLNNTYFHKRYGREIVKKYRKNAGKHPKGNDVSMTEFLMYLSGTKDEDMNEHWMSYYKLCQPCAVSYDFVGSIEHLVPDAKEVFERLGVDKQVSFPEQQKYYKPVDKQEVNGQLSNVRTQTLRKALKKYAKDFILFSYPFPKM